MNSKKEPQDQFDDSQAEILEGVDAIGTIIEEDLNYLRQRLGEIQESIVQTQKELAGLRLDQKVFENNQNEIMETLKFLTDKLNHIEIKIISGLESLTAGGSENFMASEDD
jgi:hypothetical protein